MFVCIDASQEPILALCGGREIAEHWSGAPKCLGPSGLLKSSGKMLLSTLL